ncbi:MAG: hypothetical protein ABI592_01650 [Acidobacteriota bacterium]
MKLGYGIGSKPPNAGLPARERAAAIGVALLAALSVAGRLFFLLRRPVWHDEIYTVWVSRRSAASLVAALRADSGPPLYYLLARPFVVIAEALALPDSFARLLCFAAIILTGLLGAWALGRGRGRLLFLALAATSPLLFLYSVEARAYAVVALLHFALFLLVRGESPRGGRLAAIVVLSAAALYTHYLAAFFLAALAAGALATRRRAAAAALAAGGILFIPWIPILLRQPTAATVWIHEGIPASLAGFLAALGGGARIPAPFGPPAPAALSVLCTAAGVLLLGTLAIPAARRDPDVVLGTAAVLGTLGLVLAVSFARPIAFAGRTEVAVLPVWLFVVARAAGSSRPVRILARVSAALGAAVVAGVLSAPPGIPASATVVRTLERLSAPGDVIVAGSSLYLPVELALERGSIRGSAISYPRDIAGHPGWFVPRPAQEEDFRTVEEALSALPSSGRAWFALHPAWQTPRLRAILEAHGSAREVLHGPGAALTRLETAPPGR